MTGGFQRATSLAHHATRQERQLRPRPTMMRDPLTTPANACSPDADRAGADAFARPPPEWLVHLLALVVRFILQRMFAGRSRRSLLPSWVHERPDLPLASTQAEAASLRGPFGRSIAGMCRRRGIGPGHPDWPYLSRTIVPFGGSVKGARPGLPALGLLWWENPNVTPGCIGETRATLAATAMASLLSRLAAAAAPTPAPKNIVRSDAEPALLPAFRRRVSARAATGPPTGRPAITGPPALSAHQISYA